MKKIYGTIAFVCFALLSFAQTSTQETAIGDTFFLTQGVYFDKPILVETTEIDKTGYCLFTKIVDSTGYEQHLPTLLYFTAYKDETARKQRDELLRSYNIILPTPLIEKK